MHQTASCTWNIVGLQLCMRFALSSYICKQTHFPGLQVPGARKIEVQRPSAACPLPARVPKTESYTEALLQTTGLRFASERHHASLLLQNQHRVTEVARWGQDT